MGVTRKDLFTEEQNRLALLAKALAHPARVAILQFIIKQNACINTNLVEELGLAQATISQHLRELKDAGLIQGTVEGISVNYCIHTENWNKVKDNLNSFFESYPKLNTNCC